MTPPFSKKEIILLVILGAIVISLPIAVISYTRLNVQSSAAGTVEIEPENGTSIGNVSVVNDSNASSGKYIRLGNAETTSAPGASLPISYTLSSLIGTVRYVATNGNDTTGTGTAAAPYATLAKAINVAASGDTVVIRGGIYRQGNINVPSTKTLKITAYPGEIPTFNGAQTVSSGWVTDGSLKYITYTPQPVTDGSGISFTTGQNQTASAMGKYPDQAWANGAQLRQVDVKTSVVDGTFWVDSTNNRLYMTTTDASKPNIEVSQLDKFMDINSPNSVLEGFQIIRFSNSANDYGVININGTADGVTIQNIEMVDTSFQMISFSGSSNLLINTTLKDVTLTNGNWMGVVALLTDYFTMDSVKISGMNQFNEFTQSPQSGALKTSRTWYTKVLNSEITNNKSYGLWFDQSNYDTIVANNYIANNTTTPSDNSSSNLFYEISDKLLLINNYMVQSGSGINFKTAGSGGISLVNNTILGGAAPVAIALDNRSIPGCSDPAQPLCANSYSSDRDSVRTHLATMDWMPRLDLMLNNIIAYPTGNAAYCGQLTAVCITLTNSAASTTLDAIIHKADTTRGMPQTIMNGDVIANGTGRLFRVPTIGDYYSISSFTSAMAAAPVSIGGLEANALSGNSYVNTDGSPTSALSSIHNQAQLIPTNSQINQYIPAGTRHFGVTYK